MWLFLSKSLSYAFLRAIPEKSPDTVSTGENLDRKKLSNNARVARGLRDVSVTQP